MNQGNRRGDFVRVIYNLWGENTKLIISDSSFVEGTKVIYRSGIVTDTILDPNQSAKFNDKRISEPEYKFTIDSKYLNLILFVF